MTKDYLDCGAWGINYLVKRVLNDYFLKGNTLDDLREDLIFKGLADEETADSIVRHITMMLKAFE